MNSLTVDATAQGAAPGVGGGGTDSPPPPTTTESRWNRTVHKIIRGNVLVVVMSLDRKSTRLNSSHTSKSRMPSSA